MFLETYDKNFKRTGILVDATDVQRKRRLNSDYELSFLLPMTSDDYREKVQLKGHVKDERGQFYVINNRQRIRDGRKLTAQISASHIMFKLTDYRIPYASYIPEAYGVHISRLLDVISAATNGKFTFSIDDTFDLHDVKAWGDGNALQALNDVIKMYGCELEPDNFRIHVRKKIGADNGLQYRKGKNVVTTNFKDDTNSLVTRMFAQMKDGRTWIGQPASILNEEERTLLSQVPGAIVDGNLTVNYLISPYQAYWASDSIPFFDGELIEQDIEDPLKLLEAARKALREKEIPQLEVSVSAADLFKLDKTEPRPNLGDTVTCIDPELGLDNITARITELTEYPLAADKHAQVTVANVMTRDYADIIADLEKSKNVVTNMFSNGQIRTEVFENFAKLAIKDIDASKTEINYDTRGIILVDKTDTRNQVALTSNGIVVSTDSLQTARAAITARGVVAEQIVGQLGNFVSLLIGSGNDVTQINTHGIAAGHSVFSSAPFQVDMKGNVLANKLTANSAQIKSSNFTDGAIVGSSINVGNGQFTVDTAGNMYAGNGRFRGNIEASIIRGSHIEGGSIKSNTDIDVTRDVRIGNNLTLNGENVMAPKKIEFTGVGSLDADIAFKTLEFRIAGGVFIGSRHVEGDRIATRADISALQAQITTLQTALANKSDKGHTHTVTTPHNHGNPANVSNGAGPYVTSSDS